MSDENDPLRCLEHMQGTDNPDDAAAVGFIVVVSLDATIGFLDEGDAIGTEPKHAAVYATRAEADTHCSSSDSEWVEGITDVGAFKSCPATW